METPPPSTAVNSAVKHLPPPFTNGLLKRHKPRHPVVVTYRECLKNHAAPLGGHALDGCGEFMPSPDSTSTDPTSFKCAACGCHRNFHRREPDEPPGQPVIEYQPLHRHHPPPPANRSPPESPSPPPISSSYYPSAPHMLLALSAGVSAPPPLPENYNFSNSNPARTTPVVRKRFRSKFSQDQKEKMQELAGRVGWKMQKKDEELIIKSCNEIGVEKGVFKVWMHNNKVTYNKKDSDLGTQNHVVNGIDFLNTGNIPNNNITINGNGNGNGNGSSSSS